MTKQKPKLTVEHALMTMLLSGDPNRIAVANAMALYRVIETDAVPTAATDGIVMLFNPEAIAGLTQREVEGLFVHELLHPRLDHTNRLAASGWANHRVANMAMDDEINPLVKLGGFDLPPGGCWPAQIKMPDLETWETYYPERLKQHDEAKAKAEAQGGEGGVTIAIEGGGASNDEGNGSGPSRVNDGAHATGSLTVVFAPDLAQSSGNNEADASKSPDDSKTGPPEAELANKLKSIADAITARADDVTGPERVGKAVEKAEAAREAANGQGQGRGNSTGSSRFGKPGETLEVKSGQRWQDVVVDTFLRSRQHTRIDWCRRSRRMQPGSNAYLPGKRRVNGQAIALVIDVSGSCTSYFPMWQSLTNELIEAMPEIKRIELIFHNAAICHRDQWLEHDGELILDSPRGGGTCHREAIAAVGELDVDSMILFTDCQTYWPEVWPSVESVTVLPPRSGGQRCPYGVNVIAEAV